MMTEAPKRFPMVVNTKSCARSRWACPTGSLQLAVVIFVLLSLAFVLSGNLSSNELGRLMLAKRYAQPDYLPTDWYLNIETGGPRLLFLVIFGPLTRWMPLLWVSIMGRLLGYALLSLGLARIAHKLRLDLLAVVVVGGLFCWLGHSLAAGE